ncbi:MAG: hypothetical protein ABJA76_20150 [Mucilaginibacter sp.]
MTASPLDVEIKTINLKNKKLTKSIFNQIEIRTCFDENLDFIGDRFFGYIRDKDKRYLLWSDNGKLRKTCLSDYSLPKIDAEYKFTFNDIEWVLRKCNIAYRSYDDERGRLKIELENEALTKYNSLIDNVRAFMSEVWNYQLFI